MIEEHYQDLKAKPFFKSLVSHIASGPVCCMVWEGDSVILTGRKILGQTLPFDSNPGSIRGDNCIDVGRNVVHGSDSAESAEREIKMWFTDKELVDWKSNQTKWVYENDQAVQVVSKKGDSLEQAEKSEIQDE